MERSYDHRRSMSIKSRSEIIKSSKQNLRVVDQDLRTLEGLDTQHGTRDDHISVALQPCWINTAFEHIRETHKMSGSFNLERIDIVLFEIKSRVNLDILLILLIIIVIIMIIVSSMKEQSREPREVLYSIFLGIRSIRGEDDVLACFLCVHRLQLGQVSLREVHHLGEQHPNIPGRPTEDMFLWAIPTMMFII